MAKYLIFLMVSLLMTSSMNVHANLLTRVKKEAVDKVFRPVMQTFDTIKNQINRKYQQLVQNKYCKSVVGQQLPYNIGYIPITDIQPGQLRISLRNVEKKVAEAKKKGYAVEQDAGVFTLKFDGGKSILPSDKALPVILGPEGLRLADGHHDLLSSLALGATTIPVKIIANWCTDTPQQFWKKAIDKGYVYPRNLQGQLVKPLPSGWQMENGGLVNDENRYFATIIAYKCPGPGTIGAEGAQYPVWVKIGKDIPFIEFMISDKLTKHGIFYNNKEMGEDLKSPELAALVERARVALKDDPIPGLKLVPERIHYTEINNGDICNYKYVPQQISPPLRIQRRPVLSPPANRAVK